MMTVSDMKEKKYSFSEMRLHFFLCKDGGVRRANSKQYDAELAKLRQLVKERGVSWKRVVAIAKHRKAFITENMAKAA